MFCVCDNNRSGLLVLYIRNYCIFLIILLRDIIDKDSKKYYERVKNVQR